MQEITIFDREVQDGVAEAVRSQASVAYAVSTKLAQADQIEDSLVNKIKAENKGQIDLYYLEAILVSTNWNQNDDVFLPEPTWAARHTPEDKQFNFMHNEDDIIGHITGSYIVDRNGNRVEASSDTHPDDFDIVTRVVLYTSWANEENRERMVQIIADLEGDEEKWFVSMECLFAGFDYAVEDSNGLQSVIARNEESSFLTRHLRSYGGTGSYEGFKVGRALKNISFSGEGLVDNPANKGSRIITQKNAVAFDNTHNFLTIGDINMSDSVKDQIDALKAELAEAKTENKTIKAEFDSAKEKEIQAKIEAHQAEIVEKDAAITALEDTIAELETKVSDAAKSLKTAEDALAASDEEKEKMKKEKKDKERQEALVSAGVDADKISETLASFEKLDDAAFAAVVELYNSKKAEASSSEDGEAEAGDDTDDDGAAEADALESTEAEESDLPAGDSTDEVDKTRANVAAFISEAMNIA